MLPSGEAVVVTLDFFTPIVDDAYDWGRIAATNALSDVYAMGGRPLLALNIVNWPVDDLPLDLLGRVLQGGVDAAAAAGVPVVGGHSITDPEPKYGMVVVGLVAARRDRAELDRGPGRLARPHEATRAGDRVDGDQARRRAQRPVGDGRRPHDDDERGAAEAMRETGAVAATDITGFGLLGHLHRMLLASGVSAEIDAARVPLLDPRVLALAHDGVVPGGTTRNHAFVRPFADFGDLPEVEQLVLADAQTSGGLLIATRHEDALRVALDARGIDHAVVGRVVDGEPGHLRVRGRIGDLTDR